MLDPQSVINGTPTYVQIAQRGTQGVLPSSNEAWQRTGYNGTWSPWVSTMIAFDNAGAKLATDA